MNALELLTAPRSSSRSATRLGDVEHDTAREQLRHLDPEAVANPRQGRERGIDVARFDPLEQPGRHRASMCGLLLRPAALVAQPTDVGRNRRL